MGIISLTFTIIFGLLGVLGIYITVKQNKNIKLKYKTTECYSLYKEAFDNLSVKYNKIHIKEPLIFLKGEVTNIGNQDIDKSIIHKSLSIYSKKDYNIIDANLIGENDDDYGYSVKVNNSKEISINWNILQKKKVIKFQALVVDNNKKKKNVNDITKRFTKSIDFKYIIKNLDSIENEDYKKLLNKNLFQSITIFVLFISMLFTGVTSLNQSIITEDNNFSWFFFPQNKITYKDVYYKFNKVNSDSILVYSIKAKTDSLIKLEDTVGNTKIISLVQLQNDYTIKPTKIIEDKNTITAQNITGWIFIILSSLLLTSLILNILKRKKIKEV